MYGPCNRTMKMAFFHGLTWWSNINWSDFFWKIKKSIHQVFGLLTRCNWMGIKGHDHAPRMNVRITLMNAQKRQFWKGKKKFQVWLCSSSTFFQNTFHQNVIITLLRCHGALAFFYQSTSFASPNTKPDEPCRWMMSALKDAFWGPRTPWSLWHVNFS